MELLLLLCWGLAYAIREAAAETWSQGRAAAGRARQAVAGQKAAAGARMRASDSRWAKAAVGTGAVLGGGARLGGGAVRGLARSDGSLGRWLAVGASRGWRQGASRARRAAARRRVRRRENERSRTPSPGTPWPTASERDAGRTPRDSERETPRPRETEGENESETPPREERETPRDTDREPPRDEGRPPPTQATITDLREPPPTETPRPIPDRPDVLGVDGPAASDDPRDPEPRQLDHTGHTIIEGEPAMSEIAASGANYTGAIASTDQFDALATIHQDQAGTTVQQAEALHVGAIKLRDDLARAGMDGDTMAAAGAVVEAAAAHEAEADGLAATASKLKSAIDALSAALSAHRPVAEAVRNGPSADNTDFYKSGV